MTDDRRRKQRRRTPQEIEEIKRRRKASGEVEGAPNKKKRKKKKKKMTTKKKVLIGGVSALLLIVSLIVISLGTFLGKIKKGELGDAKAPAPNEAVNVLILGLDIGDPDQVSNYDVKRTDTMMVAQYDPKAKDLDLVSVPRDTLVTENGKNYKINAAYQKGGEEKTKKLVENLLGIEINYTLLVDYNAFREFIDAIGGIDMDIEVDMKYDDPGQNLHIDFTAGTTEHLDGKKAEEFFRWRKNNDGSGLALGDIGRIENQHKFIQKVVERCTEPSIVLKVPSIISAIGDNIQTNMPSSKILSYALDMTGIDTNTVKMWTVEGDFKTIGGQDYVVFNKDYNQELMKALHNTGNSSLNKEDVSVLILNGTKINGLAGEVKDKLNLTGWTVVDVGNGNPTTKSTVYSDNEEAKNQIKKELTQITKSDKKYSDSTYNQYDVVIILGEDFKKLGE